MRKTDITKIEAIKKSVLDLSYSFGVSNLTTAKIAKSAGVSPATIYLHYEDKTDLLSRLYEEVKTNLHDGLGDAINLTQGIDDQIKQTMQYTVDQYRKYPKEAYFVATLWSNQEMLDEHAIAFGNTMEGPLADLFGRIKNSNDYEDVSSDVLEIFFTVPTMLLERKSEISNQLVEQVSTMIVKAIKK
ncbi:TetR/AcrR family transcriptional regulator [Weissella sagaensis]|uniref:TetR/AcrR family transcriptional regulator n=1 Tax=Weissella sagaensis TaxID=2559928 RepID=UPI00214BA9AC|nr:TetR/AcrR family transcriptional regulator [Weissella sagaensis]